MRKHPAANPAGPASLKDGTGRGNGGMVPLARPQVLPPALRGGKRPGASGWARGWGRMVPTGGQPVTAVGMVGLLCGQLHGCPVIEGTRNPLLLRPPLPRQLFGLGYLGRGHPLGNDIAVLDRIIAVLAGG